MKMILIFIICLFFIFLACEKETTAPQTPTQSQYPPNPGIADPGIWVSLYGNGDDDPKNGVVKYSSEGEIMVYKYYNWAGDISANNLDHNVWVANGNQLIDHLDDSGSLINSVQGSGGYFSVYQQNDDCWVSDGLFRNNSQYNGMIKRYNTDGQIVASNSGFYLPSSVACDQRNGSCWVKDREDIIKADINANILFDIYLPVDSFRVDPLDGSLWVYTYLDPDRCLCKFTENGKPTGVGINLYPPIGAWTISPVDGSLFINDRYNVLTKCTPDGLKLWETTFGYGISDIDIASDNTIWVADCWGAQIIHLNSGGQEISHFCASVNPCHLSIREEL